MMNGDIDFVKLGKAIASRRLELGFTQEELAELCNLSPSSICCIERAVRKPSLDTVMRLSHVLRVTPNQLLRDSLPSDLFGETAGKPLVLRQPPSPFCNTLTNLFLSSQQLNSSEDESPITVEQLLSLGFTLLDADFPADDFNN